MTTNIYIIRLENDKWYVGKSHEPEKSYNIHLQGLIKWTRTNRPLELYKIIANASPFDEDRYVKETMFEYGIDNVRGGSYTKTELSEPQTELIQRELFTASDGAYIIPPRIVRCNVQAIAGMLLCCSTIFFMLTTIVAGSRCWY